MRTSIHSMRVWPLVKVTGNLALPMVPTPMVYTLMPFSSASWAASIGSICPAVFSPSVSRMTTLLLASLVRRRFTATASPEPMAVPGSRSPVFSPAKPFFTTTWSVVMGTWVKASPSKATTPIRSKGRLPTKSMATSLALSSRLGSKSRASMDWLKSMAMMRSMPSRVMSSTVEADWGRNKATVRQATAKVRRTKGNSMAAAGKQADQAPRPPVVGATSVASDH